MDQTTGGVRTFGVVLTVVVTFLLLTGTATWLVVAARNDEVLDQAQRTLNQNALDASAALNEVAATTVGVAGLFESVPDVQPEQFQAFARTALDANPEVRALQYSVVVRGAEERAAFEAELVAAGVGSSILEPSPDGLIPAEARDEYVAIRFTEPVVGNEQVFGLDIAARPQGAALIERVAQTGSVAFGQPIQLAQGDGTLKAITAYQPVFDATGRLVGVAGAVLLYEQLMDRVATANSDIELELLASVNGERAVLWNGSGEATTPQDYPLETALSLDGNTVLLAGQPTQQAAFPWSVLLGGLILTATAGSLAWVARSAAYQRRRAQSLFGETVELRSTLNRDSLTGLFNRSGLAAWYEQLPTGEPRSLIYLDLDRFRDVNSAWGQREGQRLLAEVGGRIDEVARRHRCAAARIGGDEYLLGIADPPAVDAVVADLQSELVEPFLLAGTPYVVTACYGVTTGTDLDFDEAIAQADAATRLAKAEGPGSAARFTEKLADHARARQRRVSALRVAVVDPERHFQVHYQPVINLTTGEIVGAEALLRWLDLEDGAQVSPKDFIPLAESSSLIADLGRWVLERALRDRSTLGLTCIAVNVSAVQLSDVAFPADLERIIRTTTSPVAALNLEITESTAMKPEAQGQLRRIQDLGIQLSIDDFGTGYSSLSRLMELPVARLKIDRGFVADVTTSDEAAGIITAIVAMGSQLNREVVAEGVETSAQAVALRKMGVQFAQGFWFAQPMAVGELAAALAVGLPSVAELELLASGD